MKRSRHFYDPSEKLVLPDCKRYDISGDESHGNVKHSHFLDNLHGFPMKKSGSWPLTGKENARIPQENARGVKRRRIEPVSGSGETKSGAVKEPRGLEGKGDIKRPLLQRTQSFYGKEKFNATMRKDKIVTSNDKKTQKGTAGSGCSERIKRVPRFYGEKEFLSQLNDDGLFNSFGIRPDVRDYGKIPLDEDQEAKPVRLRRIPGFYGEKEFDAQVDNDKLFSSPIMLPPTSGDSKSLRNQARSIQEKTMKRSSAHLNVPSLIHPKSNGEPSGQSPKDKELVPEIRTAVLVDKLVRIACFLHAAHTTVGKWIEDRKRPEEYKGLAAVSHWLEDSNNKEHLELVGKMTDQIGQAIAIENPKNGPTDSEKESFRQAMTSLHSGHTSPRVLRMNTSKCTEYLRDHPVVEEIISENIKGLERTAEAWMDYQKGLSGTEDFSFCSRVSSQTSVNPLYGASHASRPASPLLVSSHIISPKAISWEKVIDAARKEQQEDSSRTLRR